MPGNAEPFNAQQDGRITVPFPLTRTAVDFLKQDGKTALNVLPKHFHPSWYAIYVTKVQVFLHGLATFSATITHPGRGGCQTEDPATPLQMFSMLPRTSFATQISASDLGATGGSTLE